MNNNVCNYVAQFLKDYDVEITRVDDITGVTDVALQTRTNKVNAIKPDLFVSVHHNANTGVWGNWSYVVGFYHYKKTRDKDLANSMATELSKLTGIKSNGAWSDDKIYPNAGFHIIRETLSTIPSILVEGGFMDSTIDYPIITSDKGQRAYAQSIANVCISYLKLKKNNVSTVTSGNPIMGKSVLTANQMTNFLLSKNAKPNLKCTPLQLAEYYISEGNTEGVRGDVAFAQAIHETGYFKYGGDVLPEQNNYCGYAATNTTEKGKGAWFSNPQMGVRCHIQHLKSYASKDALKKPLVQPSNGVQNRFHLVTRGIAPNWEDLNGKWAIPGTNYGQTILKTYTDMTNYKSPTTTYSVKVEIDSLNIRSTPETVSTNIVGAIKDKGIYTIIEEKNGFGKLKSGAGWINLSYTKRI